VRKTWKEVGTLAQNRISSWKPFAPKGVKGNKSNLNYAKCEISRHSKNKKREYLKDKMNELATNNKKNIRDLYKAIN
jgi:hypothetical protein